MTHIYKNFYCDSDGTQITLYELKLTTDSRRAKEENLGKERYNAIGYYTDIESMLNAVSRLIQRRKLAEAPEMSEMLEILKEIQAEIKELTTFGKGEEK